MCSLSGNCIAVVNPGPGKSYTVCAESFLIPFAPGPSVIITTRNVLSYYCSPTKIATVVADQRTTIVTADAILELFQIDVKSRCGLKAPSISVLLPIVDQEVCAQSG